MNIIKNEVLKDQNALNVFLSQLISTVCDKMMSIGLVWFLTTKFSINIVPWFLMVSFLPHVFMSFISSRLINHIGVLKTVVYSEFYRGVVLLFLYVSLFYIEDHSQLFLVFLFLASFLVGIGSSLFNPAILSLPPNIVEEKKVPALNAILDTSFSISTILGAACSIFLLNIFSLKILILINALSFIFAGILQSFVKEINHSSLSESDVHVSPLIVLRKYLTIKRLLISFLFINIIFTPILVMIPWYVENVFHGNGSDLAIIEGAMGVGAFFIGLYLSMGTFVVDDSNRTRIISLICLLFGFFFVAFSFSTNTYWAALCLFFIGILSTFLNVQVLTYFQVKLLPQEVPAIMVAVNIISTASMPLSFALSGFLFPVVKIPLLALSCGALTMIMSLFMPKYLSQKSGEL